MLVLISEPLEGKQIPVSPSDDDVLVLQQAIGFLNPTNKATVILHLEGYDHNEIAKMLSLSETNVSTKLSRSKKMLKKIIKSLQHESR